MSKWQDTTIGDVITLQRGFDITRATQRPGNVPVVSSGGIGSYHDTPMAKGPGVVIGRKGTLGKVFYLPQDYWPHDTSLWVKDFKGNNPKFVYYFLRTMDFLSMDVGSSNPTLNRNHVHPIGIQWPPVPEQKAIASVLGILDDKIAVNDRIVATLHQLANTHYRRVHSTSADWVPRPLGEVAMLTMGQSPAGETCNREGIGLPLLNGPTEFGQYSPSPAQWTTTATRVCTTGDLLLCVRGSTTGRLNWADQEYILGRGLASIRARQSPRYTNLIYLSLLEKMSGLLALTSGSVFPNLSRKSIEAFLIAWPSTDSTPALVDLLSSFMDQTSQYVAENKTSAELRDTLLPKLMSGEIRVRDAEKAVEEAT